MQALGREDIDALLASPTEAFLGTLAADGSPRVTPVWFVRNDDEIWMSSTTDRAKVEQLRRDARACLALHARSAGRNRGVQVRGQVQVDPSRAGEVADALCRKYRSDDFDRCRGYFDRQPRVALILPIGEVTSWG